MELDEATLAKLSGVATATLTTVLLKKGLRNVWLRGTKPLRPGQKRVVGRAFTRRFVPAREDLATPESWNSPISTREAIEAMPAGRVAVVDAMGITDAGIFGDTLCERMKVRGVAAPITDGVVRDLAGVLGTGLPAWCGGAAALLDQVVDAAVEQERLEAWIVGELQAGGALPGLYPANAENKARYEAYRTSQAK
jgi:regulator of RNase E activity RraA